MKIPRDVSGHTLAEALCRYWDYTKVHQVGSHIVLQTHTPVPHRIAIPAHAALRIGTPIGPRDVLIAGTALAHQATLITHNVREFRRARGPSVMDWF